MISEADEHQPGCIYISHRVRMVPAGNTLVSHLSSVLGTCMHSDGMHAYCCESLLMHGARPSWNKPALFDPLQYLYAYIYISSISDNRI